jgi:ABC-type sugar transport system permease subunit
MKNKAYPFYFAIGALFLYSLFFVLPSVMGVFYSFTDWNSYTTEVNWVGLDNFKTIFSSTGQGYISFIKNTVVFTIATIILKTVIALGLAVLLTQGVRRLSYFHRVIIYLPAVLPMLVVSLIFRSHRVLRLRRQSHCHPTNAPITVRNRGMRAADVPLPARYTWRRPSLHPHRNSRSRR